MLILFFTKASFIQCEQFLLNKNFRQYLETIMVSKKNLETGVRPKNTHTKNIWNFNRVWLNQHRFLGSNRQSDWLEISIVYDKSDKHSYLWQRKRWASCQVTTFDKVTTLATQPKKICYINSLLPGAATDAAQLHWMVI